MLGRELPHTVEASIVGHHPAGPGVHAAGEPEADAAGKAHLRGAAVSLFQSGHDDVAEARVQQQPPPEGHIDRAIIEDVLVEKDHLLAVLAAGFGERDENLVHDLGELGIDPFHLGEEESVEAAGRGLEDPFHRRERHVDGMAVPGPNGEVRAVGFAGAGELDDLFRREVIAPAAIQTAAPEFAGIGDLLAERDPVHEAKALIRAVFRPAGEDDDLARLRLVGGAAETAHLFGKAAQVVFDPGEPADGTHFFKGGAPAGPIEAHRVDRVTAGDRAPEVERACFGIVGAVGEGIGSGEDFAARAVQLVKDKDVGEVAQEELVVRQRDVGEQVHAVGDVRDSFVGARPQLPALVVEGEDLAMLAPAIAEHDLLLAVPIQVHEEHAEEPAAGIEGEAAEAGALPDHFQGLGIDEQEREVAAQSAGSGRHRGVRVARSEDVAGSQVADRVFGFQGAQDLAMRRESVKDLLDAAGEDDRRTIRRAGHGDLVQRRGSFEDPHQSAVVVDGVEGAVGGGDEGLVQTVAVDVGDGKVAGQRAAGRGPPE